MELGTRVWSEQGASLSRRQMMQTSEENIFPKRQNKHIVYVSKQEHFVYENSLFRVNTSSPVFETEEKKFLRGWVEESCDHQDGLQNSAATSAELADYWHQGALVSWRIFDYGSIIWRVAKKSFKKNIKGLKSCRI